MSLMGTALGVGTVTTHQTMWFPLLDANATSQNSSHLAFILTGQTSFVVLNASSSCSLHQLLASCHTLVLFPLWCKVVHTPNLTLTWWLLTLHSFLSLPLDRHLRTFFDGLKSISFAHFLAIPFSSSHWLITDTSIP